MLNPSPLGASPDRTDKAQRARRRRPKLFRALGDREPPESIWIAREEYRRVEILKHDSWAATALYECGDRRLVCKFNRIQSIFCIPCRWLGRLLARRERKAYARLADVPRVPRSVDSVHVDGRMLRNAVAHEYVPGHPLRWHDRVDDDFFPRLQETLQEIHRQGIAYMDLNKRENIILGEDGQPHLIDFQISLKVPRIWPLTVLLRWLQQSDDYHLQKHFIRFRPDLNGWDRIAAFETARPWWISLHRMMMRPVRGLRRKLLVWLGIRDKSGKAHSEAFVEEALRGASGDSPLLDLQATLNSDAYYRSKGENAPAYVTGMFEDLFGRPPTEEADRKLVASLLRTPSRRDISSVMFRTAEVCLRSDNLSDKWVSGLHQQIIQRLVVR